MTPPSRGDLRTLANGLFPTGQELPPTQEGRDEIREAVNVILKLHDARSARLTLALRGLDRAAEEIERLRGIIRDQGIDPDSGMPLPRRPSMEATDG